MGKNVILATILVILLVADVSNAAFLRNFRKLAATPPIEDPNKPGTPIPNPSPVSPRNPPSSVGGEEKGKEKKQIGPPPATTAGKDASKDKKAANDTHTTPVTPPIEAKEHNNTSKEAVKDKAKEEEKKEEEKEKAEEKEEDKKEKEEEQKEKGEEKNKEVPKEKAESKPAVPVGSIESCDEIGRRCQDLKSMTACVKSFDSDSKTLVLIQNKGDISLKVDVSAMSSRSKQVTVPKLRSKKVKMSLADGGINEITLNAGNGNCMLPLGTPALQGNYFQFLPSYSKFMTPTYGAYLVLVITLIAGGVLGCCWLSKRKGQQNIPYQELELSMPESAVAAETVEGWDEVWDDDWDEENAVRSPGGHRISANGLTARNSKKDDWEDWDD